MPNKRILILGGTRDARDLANQLVAEGFDVTTSLAGVTESPTLPSGHIRSGGFGGVDGLAAYLRAEKFDHVIDATHPFAAQISTHAVVACAETRNPLLRLERAAWMPEPGDQWTIARDIAEARDLLPPDAKVMLTLGRKEVSIFFEREDLGGVARMIEPPAATVPKSFTLLLQRPPYGLDGELLLLRDHNVEYLLCKNSGGPRARKLDAARSLGLTVVMVARPAKPVAPTVQTVEEAVALVLGRGPSTG